MTAMKITKIIAIKDMPNKTRTIQTKQKKDKFKDFVCIKCKKPIITKKYKLLPSHDWLCEKHFFDN